jgi:hypothetical protein
VEQCLIEQAPGIVAGEAAQLVGLREQVEDGRQGFAAGVQVRPLGAGELGLEAGAFVADGP